MYERTPVVRTRCGRFSTVRVVQPGDRFKRKHCAYFAKVAKQWRIASEKRVAWLLLNSWKNAIQRIFSIRYDKGNAMKKTILATAFFAAFASSACAQQAAASDHTFTGNLTLASDYRFRGISQTFRKPTIQGGFDYAHSSGFYLGNWNSNVSGNQYPDGASLEMDFYGGYKFEAAPGLTADVGLLKYYYPGARIAGVKPDALELYVGASWKWFSAKYSHAVSDDYFGFEDADGSYYLDLNANFEVADKTVLGFHVGRQKFKNYGDFNYTDYKVSVSRDFGFATLGLALVGSNADEASYTYANTSGSKSKDVSKTTAVLSVSKTF